MPETETSTQAETDSREIEKALLVLGFKPVPEGHRLAAYTLVRETIDPDGLDHQQVTCMERYSEKVVDAKAGVLLAAAHAVIDMLAAIPRHVHAD
jgi:hypothetical protein